MEDKYLSVITNFGCHYTCPYCIVKNNNLHIPATTLQGLDKLEYYIDQVGANIVSVFGGGDPLYNYDEHQDWYKKLFEILDKTNCRFELHTSYINNVFSSDKCYRIVYHCRDIEDIEKIQKCKETVTRAVYVVQDRFTEDDISYIYEYYKHSPNIDELSFRQRVDKGFVITYHLHDYLLAGHKNKWWYIQQGDYNTYYAENEIHTEFNKFK